MRYSCVLVILILLIAPVSSRAFGTRVFQLREDFGSEPLYDTALQYYYYIPCPTYSWFQAFSGWEYGDVLGQWFQLGDISTGTFSPGDPLNCQTLDQIRVLDFAGYGTVRPGIFTVEFEIYCSDEFGCPVGPSLWSSGPWETSYAWNYIWIDPPLDLCDCSGGQGTGPRVLLTATHSGSDSYYPAWGTDIISTNFLGGCVMHDYGCLPALYPRPYSSHYASIHSGYYGQDFQYCPPQWFKDGNDPTPDGTQYGFTELAWRIYIVCDGPSADQPATWSSIKSMYR